MANTLTTQDGLLNRRIVLEQPEMGYRVAIDTVFLAAAVPAAKGDRILDLGCGVGGAMLCVACRVEDITGTGIEIQPDLVELCHRNVLRNDFTKGLSVLHGDASDLPADWHGTFDHVLMNPPYHEEARHDVSANIIKQTANMEKSGDLKAWIRSATDALKVSGTLTLIHRADRRDEILSCLRDDFGSCEILSLLPKQGADAKRIIIRTRKGGGYAVRQCAPLTLHKPEGGYTDEAEDILRHCKAMKFSD